jgi:hypothetical protein
MKSTLTNMRTKDLVNGMLVHMLTYQRTKCISRRCIDNCQYLRDSLTVSGIPCTVAAVIAHSNVLPFTVLVIHLVVIDPTTGKIIDPSYETRCFLKSTYYLSGEDFIRANPQWKGSDKLTAYLDELKHFQGVARDINAGICRISNKEYYHNQADYVEQKLKPYIN